MVRAQGIGGTALAVDEHVAVHHDRGQRAEVEVGVVVGRPGVRGEPVRQLEVPVQRQHRVAAVVAGRGLAVADGVQQPSIVDGATTGSPDAALP
jgi:hypothetical protein